MEKEKGKKKKKLGEKKRSNEKKRGKSVVSPVTSGKGKGGKSS